MIQPELLTDPAEVATLLACSDARPVMIFKHSLTCPVSFAAYGEYQRFLAHSSEVRSVEHRLIEVQNARDASTAVAEHTGVRHESPQALLLSNGSVVWNQSHGRLTEEAFARAIAALD